MQFAQIYEIVRCIKSTNNSNGGFYEVFQARNKSTGVAYSAKKIDKQKLNRSTNTKKNIHRGEMDSLRAVNHPNIIKTTQIIENEFFLYIL